MAPPEDHPQTPSSAGSANPEKPRRQRTAQKWRSMTLANKIVASATAVMAVATVVYTVVSLKTLHEIQSGGTDTHNLAESAVASSRAWIVVQGTGFGVTKDKGFPTARVVLADSGSSPAFGVNGWRCAEIRSEQPPFHNGELAQSPNAVCLPVPGGELGKGVPILFDTFIPVPPPTNFAHDQQSTGPHFYVWGRLTYDIYPPDYRHFFSFCLENFGSQLGACASGNGGD